MSAILITGGAGFIGSHVVEALLSHGVSEHLIVLDAFTYAANKSWMRLVAQDHPDKLTLVEGDLCNRPLLVSLFEGSNIVKVVHLAAESHVDRSIDGASEFTRTNVMGTQVLLDVMRLYSKCHLIHISTDEVYGPIDSALPVKEDAPLRPQNPYAASKAAAEHFVAAYVNTYKLSATVLRLCNQYGPRQHAEKLIPKMALNAVANKAIPLYGKGENMREWLFVTDGARAIELAIIDAKQGTESLDVYNVGSGYHERNLDLAHKVLTLTQDSKSHIEFVADRPGHDFCYAVDSTKIERALKWRPKVEFAQGLELTLDYYQNLDKLNPEVQK